MRLKHSLYRFARVSAVKPKNEAGFFLMELILVLALFLSCVSTLYLAIGQMQRVIHHCSDRLSKGAERRFSYFVLNDDMQSSFSHWQENGSLYFLKKNSAGSEICVQYDLNLSRLRRREYAAFQNLCISGSARYTLYLTKVNAIASFHIQSVATANVGLQIQDEFSVWDWRLSKLQ